MLILLVNYSDFWELGNFLGFRGILNSKTILIMCLPQLD